MRASPWLINSHFLLHPYLLERERDREGESTLVSLLTKGTNPIHESSILIINLPKIPPPNITLEDFNIWILQGRIPSITLSI